MNSADVKYRETLFWELAQQLLAEPGVTQSTMIARDASSGSTAPLISGYKGVYP